jgi:hypothetical protein
LDNTTEILIGSSTNGIISTLLPQGGFYQNGVYFKARIVDNLLATSLFRLPTVINVFPENELIIEQVEDIIKNNQSANSIQKLQFGDLRRTSQLIYALVSGLNYLTNVIIISSHFEIFF